MASQPPFDRLKSQLLTSGLSGQNQPLFQVINQLIDAMRQSISTSDRRLGELTSNVSNISFASAPIPFMMGGGSEECDYIEPYHIPGIIGPVGPPGPSGGMFTPIAMLDELFEETIPVPLAPISIFPPLGQWIDIPYAAGNFTAAAGTWTVDLADQISFKYAMIGVKTMIIEWAFNTTTYAGGPGNELRFKIPNGAVARTTDVLSAIRANDNGVDTVGFCGCVAAATYIRLWRSAFANWDNTSVNNTTVQGVACFEIL